MASKKSHDIKWLLLHGLFIGLVLLPMLVYLPFPFILVYAATHCIQDGLIWNIYKDIRCEDDINYWEDKLFYSFIGLDRTLHIICGITLIYIFTK
jgi:hypothetical protein